MACQKCDSEAVYHAPYSGSHLCADHLQAAVERRVRARVREDDLLPASATTEDPVRWVIGLSGGKDSVVLTTVLAETFGADPRVELVALSVHEGIAGYRDESLAASERLVDTLEADVRHETVSYAEEFGVRMDDVVEDDPEDMAPCAYCGTFRRDVLARHADRLDADLLLTGHNLDDEAETALMNVLAGDVDRIARHFEASLGPLGERSTADTGDGAGGGAGDGDGDGDDDGADATAVAATPADWTEADHGPFVPRAKPLRDVPEKEVALYCRLRDLPAHIHECPHAARSFRGRVQSLLHELEDDHPGTRHSIMAGYEDLAALAARDRAGDDEPPDRELSPCESCGSPTGRSVCRTCELLAALDAD